MVCKVCDVTVRWVEWTADAPDRGGRWVHISGTATHLPEPTSRKPPETSRS